MTSSGENAKRTHTKMEGDIFLKQSEKIRLDAIVTDC